MFRSFCLLLCVVVATTGCNRSTSSSKTTSTDQASKDSQATEEPEVFVPKVYEANAEQLLEARLDAQESAEGWVRLFDGHTLFGWEIAGNVNWRIEDGALVADQGDVGLICTSTTWDDFEMTTEFQASAETNGGIFIRTPFDPMDPSTDCYEINIAPDSNPFPTGSIVGRQKVDAEAAGQPTPDQWRTMTIRAEGDTITVSLDTQVVCEYTDQIHLNARRIGLQHNSGRIAYRNVKVKPLNLQSTLDQDLSQWKKYPEMPGSFTVNEEGALHVQGGRTQLETKESYGDFALLAQYQLAEPSMNSGIFFRCIPGDEMMGYECQVSNEMSDGNPLAPTDHGTGGIFRRQVARVVAGYPDQPSSVLLVAHGDRIAAWVNGVQVSDWQDTRDEHENPRKGKRLDPGTIMIQGHDPGTDALFQKIDIVKLSS